MNNNNYNQRGQNNRRDSDGHFNVRISDEDYERETRRRQGGGYDPRTRNGRQPMRDDRAIRDQRPMRDQRPPQGYRDGRAYDGRQQRPAARQSSNNHGCLKAFLYAVFVLAVSALLSVAIIAGMNDMLGLVKDDVQITVKIPSDADLATVSRILGDESVVNHPVLFKWYSKYTNRDRFVPGTFELNAKSDYDLLIRTLTTPYPLGQKTVRVTIPEGLNVEQIAEMLDSAYVCENAKFFNTLNNHEWKHTFYPNVPAGVNGRVYRLEGYLFPSTYEFYIKGVPLYNINKLLNGFNDRVLNNKDVDFDGHVAQLREKYSGKIDQEINMDFIVTLASIIEREAQKPEDMRVVASVFYNRLCKTDSEGINGRLESDATMWYPYPTEKAMRASGKLTDAQKDAYASGNPYNTHNISGLPPGPICCPGLNAINAALDPAESGFYYFFSDSEGTFHFAENYSKFSELLAQYGT